MEKFLPNFKLWLANKWLPMWTVGAAKLENIDISQW